eukprot:CAMPEP_0183790102 /NCGR_PEP_ID=MMETSP0803_2-20130417/802_1 /TAXON_ID=195967 /ORGANISM="Crustomastix stigmata, Strain CCMP3273" /LENGTH=671 /DNA_ID=CAMNT_0026034293 /DNA_START=530 /DNA_END=2545 /DNA_ORIENTATION=+
MEAVSSTYVNSENIYAASETVAKALIVVRWCNVCDEHVKCRNFIHALKVLNSDISCKFDVNSALSNLLDSRMPLVQRVVQRTALSDLAECLLHMRRFGLQAGRDILSQASILQQMITSRRLIRKQVLRASRAGVPLVRIACGTPRREVDEDICMQVAMKIHLLFQELGKEEKFRAYYWQQRQLQLENDRETHVKQKTTEFHKEHMYKLVGFWGVERSLMGPSNQHSVETVQLCKAWVTSLMHVCEGLSHDLDQTDEPQLVLMLCSFVTLFSFAITGSRQVSYGSIQHLLAKAYHRFHECSETCALQQMNKVLCCMQKGEVCVQSEALKGKSANSICLHQINTRICLSKRRVSHLFGLTSAQEVQQFIQDSMAIHQILETNIMGRSLFQYLGLHSTSLVRKIAGLCLSPQKDNLASEKEPMSNLVKNFSVFQLARLTKSALLNFAVLNRDHYKEGRTCTTEFLLKNKVQFGNVVATNTFVQLVWNKIKVIKEEKGYLTPCLPFQQRQQPSQSALAIYELLEEELNNLHDSLPGPLAQSVGGHLLASIAKGLMYSLATPQVNRFNLFTVLALDIDVKLFEGLCECLSVSDRGRCFSSFRTLLDILLDSESESISATEDSLVRNGMSSDFLSFAEILEKYTISIAPVSHEQCQTSLFPSQPSIRLLAQHLRGRK